MKNKSAFKKYWARVNRTHPLYQNPHVERIARLAFEAGKKQPISLEYFDQYSSNKQNYKPL